MNHSKLRMLFAVCLSLPILNAAIALRVAAQTPLNTVKQQLVFNEAFEPTEGERPNTRGGGARPAPNCPGSSQAIKPLMPEQNYGLTFEERPTIFVNLPATASREVWLSFQHQTGAFVEPIILPLPQTSGIIPIALPENAPPLETGKTYQWSLIFICDREDPDPVNSPHLTGYVTRITRTAEIEAEFAQKTAIEQAQWYADRGYWYDLLSTLARSRLQSPDDAHFKTLWESLLTSVGLEKIASEPLQAID